MSGCIRRVRHIPVEPPPPPHKDTNNTVPPPITKRRLYDTSRTEAKYNLKQEPYSVGSKQKDPELLGPQRTIEKTKTETSIHVVTAQPASKPSAPTKTTASLMTKEECISMIGNAKFERYSKRFGGESGAIKRCALLKKLKRN